MKGESPQEEESGFGDDRKRKEMRLLMLILILLVDHRGDDSDNSCAQVLYLSNSKMGLRFAQLIVSLAMSLALNPDLCCSTRLVFPPATNVSKPTRLG